MLPAAGALFQRRQRASVGINYNNGGLGSLWLTPYPQYSSDKIGTSPGYAMAFWIRPLNTASGTCDITGVADVETSTLYAALLLTMDGTNFNVTNQTGNTSLGAYTLNQWYFFACNFTSTTLAVWMLSPSKVWTTASVSTITPLTPFDGFAPPQYFGNVYHNSASFDLCGLRSWKNRQLNAAERMAESRQLEPATPGYEYYVSNQYVAANVVFQDAPYYRKNSTSFSLTANTVGSTPPVPSVHNPYKRIWMASAAAGGGGGPVVYNCNFFNML